jgi:hypothetical protein
MAVEYIRHVVSDPLRPGVVATLVERAADLPRGTAVSVASAPAAMATYAAVAVCFALPGRSLAPPTDSQGDGESVVAS